MTAEKEMLNKIAERSAEILGDSVCGNVEEVLANHDFIKSCYNLNERGDALLLAEILKDRFLFIPPPPNKPSNKGIWYKWDKVIWQVDDFNSILAEVEYVAQAYEGVVFSLRDQQAEMLVELEEEREAKVEAIKLEYSGDPDEADRRIAKLRKRAFDIPKWLTSSITNFEKRAFSLRSQNKMNTAVNLAPALNNSIAVTPNFLDQCKMLLPAGNGVIDLERGMIVDAKPEDLMTRRIEVNFEPTADYSLWEELLNDICVHPDKPGTKEIPAFLKRFFGYCLTGNVNEESLLIFIGPGRNGKGTILETISSIMSAFFHQAARSLFIEQKFEPPASAASEHLYALMHKRIVIGSETNKGQNVDGGRVKEMTGGNPVKFRKNFGSEEIYTPTHKLILETNNSLGGLTKEFSLRERLVIIDFLWRYVDDVEAAEKKEPALKGRFKKKDTGLKKRLKEPKMQEAVLKWMVEGCLEWQEKGLEIPSVCNEFKLTMEKAENNMGRFVEEMLEVKADVRPEAKTRILFTDLYDKVFIWWWKENMDSTSKMTHKNTLAKYLRENGFESEKVGGKIYFYNLDVKDEIKIENSEMRNLTNGFS
ncbi:MAG: phage/plasmid primase, P4 family [Desulfotalea sp.]